MSRHGRGVEIDPTNPTHTALCQRCGSPYNRYKLGVQTRWAGPVLIDTGFRVCPACMDAPNEQERTLILPPDPLPIFDALPNSTPMDMRSVYTLFSLPFGLPMFPALASFSVILKKG